MTHITGVTTALPANEIPSRDLVEQLCRLAPSRREVVTRLARRSGVSSRRALRPLSALLDGSRPPEEGDRRDAIPLAVSAARSAVCEAGVEPSSIRGIVSVSSTLLSIPSIEVHVMNELGLDPLCRRVPLSHLGCAGGLTALAVADDVLAGAGGGSILLVAAEFPSLHLPVGEVSLADLHSVLTCGDAVGAMVLSPGSSKGAVGPLELVATRSVLFPQTTRASSFSWTSAGLRSAESTGFASVVRGNLSKAVTRFLQDQGFSKEDVDLWLMPGRGLDLLDVARAELNLTEDDLRISRDTLAQFGNSLGSGVFLLLESALRGRALGEGQLGMLLSIGAGVTCQMALFRR